MHSSRRRTACLLTVCQHALHRGSMYPSMHCAEGVCITAFIGQGEGCLPGGCLPGGVCCGGSARGVCPGEGVCLPLLWTEWQTGVKTLPCCNFVAGGNYYMPLLLSIIIKYSDLCVARIYQGKTYVPTTCIVFPRHLKSFEFFPGQLM